MEASLLLASSIAKEFEGLALKAYHDPVGYPTQGYGHLLSKEPWTSLEQYPDITEATANKWLLEDMQASRMAVLKSVEVLLTPYQEAALIDFTFNVGVGNFTSSTLLRELNKGDYARVPIELRKWVYSRGIKLNGLARRREAEIVLFTGEPNDQVSVSN